MRTEALIDKGNNDSTLLTHRWDARDIADLNAIRLPSEKVIEF